MAFASLYRKYRPSNFDEVIGQNVVVRTLGNMVKHSSFAHAYLFTGTRGTGKTSVARIFAKAINCTDPQNGSPCCRCEACKAFDQFLGVDIVEMDAASNSGVQDIRDLRDSVQYPPVSPLLRYKVYIIDEVHQLSNQAFNAFLKTLEEPPEYCIFILATTEVQKLPQTILSRCLRFDFSLVSIQDLTDHLARIFDKEGAKYSLDALRLIARAGQGSVRDTLSIADTCLTASDGDVTFERVLEVLGSNDPSLVADVCAAILQGNMGDALRFVDDVAAKGKSIVMLSKDISQYLRDLLILASDNNANDYLRLLTMSVERAKDIISSCSRADLVRVLSIFTGIETSMRYAGNPRTILETAIAKAITSSGNETADMMGKIAALEKKLAAMGKELQEGVRVVSVKQEEARKQVEQAVEVDEATQQDDIFADEPISSMPSEAMQSNAIAVQYRSAITAKLQEHKYLLIATMMSSTFVKIIGNKVQFVCSQDNDRQYLQRNQEVIASLSKDLLSFEPTYEFIYNPRKQSDHDDVNNLINIVGANKVTKKQ